MKERAPIKLEKDIFGLTIDDTGVKLIALVSPKLGSKVLSYNSATIPKGVVVQGHVEAPNRLAKIIIELKKKAKPRSCQQHFAIIGLPENQIFIQTIEVPKELTEPEISRTIEHQSNKIFPVSYKDIILDWQIVGKDKTKKRILIIAAPGDMIKSLIETARIAKIQPLAIEPKSFAIHRLLTFILRKQSLIMVDFEQQSASLSIYQAGEIKFHTKIGAPLTVETVSGAISRTIYYYKDRYPKASDIKRVVFSGDTGEQYFMEQVSKNFPKIQVEKITLPEFKASKDFNERRVFLASAIALALKRINIFAKHQSINLLPTYVKNNYRIKLAQHYFGMIARLMFIFLFFLVVGLTIFTFKANLDLGTLSRTVATKESQPVAKDLRQKEEVIKEVNRKAAKLVQLSQKDQDIPALLKKLTNTAPKELSITTISIADGKGVIAGIGPRSQIINYREELSKNDKITQVNLPLSSLEKEQQADFLLEFTISQ